MQANLARLQTDQQALQAEIQALGPTLKADEQAIQAAIQGAIQNDPNVHSAEANLQDDQASARTTIRDDQAAIRPATNGSQRQAAVAKYFGDLVSTGEAIAADEGAVQAAMDADSGVESSRAQLDSDQAPIRADVMTVVADEAQLEKDIQAALEGPKGA